MLETIFYNGEQFKSQAIAESKGEVYRVRYAGELMIITFPCGREKQVKLQMPMSDRVSSIDKKFMMRYIGDDMDKRKKEAEEALLKPKYKTVGAGEKTDPTLAIMNQSPNK